jgi:hypothetical protein
MFEIRLSSAIRYFTEMFYRMNFVYTQMLGALLFLTFSYSACIFYLGVNFA